MSKTCNTHFPLFVCISDMVDGETATDSAPELQIIELYLRFSLIFLGQRCNFTGCVFSIWQ